MKDALAGFVPPDPKKKKKKPSPYSNWRLLVVSPDTKEIFKLRRLFQDRFKVIECAINNNEAQMRITDQFAPSMELIMLDDRLMDRKSIRTWAAALKAPLKRPNTVLVTNAESPPIDPIEVAATLGCLGILDPFTPVQELVKELLISTGHVKYVPELGPIEDFEEYVEDETTGIVVPADVISTTDSEPEPEEEFTIEVPSLGVESAPEEEPDDPSVTIPMCPDALAAVLKELSAESPNNTEINKFLEQDPQFSEVAVRTINSAYYGLETPVESVGHALRLLGGNEFRILAQLVAAKRAFAAAGVRQSEFAKRVWRHGFASGLTCMHLAHVITDRWAKFSPYDMFLMGLFHNTGMLLIYRERPQYRNILKERFKSDFTGAKQTDWEMKNYQMDHSDLSARVSKMWKVDPDLVEVIRFQPKADKVTHPDEMIISMASLLSFGDSLGNEYLYPGYSLHGNKQHIDPFLEYLNVTFKEFLEVRELVAEHTKRLSYVFNSG